MKERPSAFARCFRVPGAVRGLRPVSAGLMWDDFGHAAVFFLGAGWALAGCIALRLLIREPARPI